MTAGVFVTGADTGVGKTVVSACLCRAWGADYFKPVQTGLAEEEGDTALVARLAGLGADRIHPPRFAFQAPLSPHLAAAREGGAILAGDIALPRTARPLVVEGAGGFLSPLNTRELMADLAVRLGLPVVIAAADRLGGIGQAVLALEAVRARGLDLLGVILTGGPFADNAEAIALHGRTRIIAALPAALAVDSAWVENQARSIPALAAMTAN